MVNHAVDRFLVSRNDSGREHHGVSLFDFGVLVVVHSRAGERGHRLALGAADHHTDFFGCEVLHLARVNQQALGNFDIAEVLSNFRRTVHGAADESDLASVFPGQLDRQLDAMYRRRKAGNKKSPLGASKYFVKFTPHGALAWRITPTLDVG